jgi:hypothetical protein
MTFDALHAGGWENALMDDVSKRIRQLLGESGSVI